MSPEPQEKLQREIVIGVNGKPRPMTHRERIFAMAYGDPASSTFANGSQSVLRAAPDLLPDSAKVEANRLLSRANVTNTIADIMNKAGLGIEVRADSIARIISHRDIGKVVSRTSRSEEGEAITETTHGPGYKDMLKAIDVANKMDGLYAKQQAGVDLAADEYRHLSKRFFQGSGGSRPPTDHTVISPVESVEGPAIDAAPTLAPRQGKRTKRTPTELAPQGAGGGGQPESRASVVSPSPTAGENLARGGI